MNRKKNNNNIKKNRFSFILLSNRKFLSMCFVVIFLFTISIINLVYISLNNMNFHSNDMLAAKDPKYEYYKRLEKVKNEYKGAEKEFSEIVITAIFNMLSINVDDFSFDDMSESSMREVADLMLKETENEDGSIIFSPKSEDDVKESLVDYFKKVSPNLDEIIYRRIADDVYEYIEAYEELIGKEEESISSSACDGNSYWWPIGSSEITTDGSILMASGSPVSSSITAYFAGNDSVHNGSHGALDISNGNGVGGTYIIAAKSGTVVYPTNDIQTQYSDNGYYGNTDGSGFGNYVVIQHSDGNYTYYAHMAQNSITVRAGDNVRQGQVIGKMGNSGSSTGVHLHFEIRSGGNSSSNRVDPLEYVSIDNPRSGCVDFSLVSTSLSKQEFIAKMESYCTSSGNSAFCTNFSSHAEEVYDVSVSSSVNPELVVVTAGTEQGWQKCGGLYNFWGIGIPNGATCSAGPQLTSLADGIRKYAETLNKYQEGGSFDSAIESRNQEREEAGCDAAGHGPPGSLAGMQSIYSWVGDYRYSPGSWGMGGCKYLNIIYGSNYCSTKSVCTNYSSCPSSSATTVCEQNDYTAWQLKEKLELRNSIFGL